jgi:large-conductance mechanosensitive channel
MDNLSEYQLATIWWGWIITLIILVAVVFFIVVKNMTRKMQKAGHKTILKNNDILIKALHKDNTIGSKIKDFDLHFFN